jgi:hypothetical protein
MDLVLEHKGDTPDCWSGYGQMMSAINFYSPPSQRPGSIEELVDAAAVEACGNQMQEGDTAIERLTQIIKEHPDRPEAILAARYLANTENARGLVVPYCAYVLHEILHADKLVQMKEVAVDVIRSMSRYGEDAAPFSLDVVGCLLLKDCPPEVKEAVLDFLVATTLPGNCDGAFSVVANQSDDPVIQLWNIRRKRNDDEEEENQSHWSRGEEEDDGPIR